MRSVFLVALGLSACLATVAADVCGALRATWEHEFVPHHTNPKPLLIGAGEGTTGTHTVAHLLSSVDGPRRVAHWHVQYVNGRERKDGAYVPLRKRLEALAPADRQAFDFDVFGPWDGVTDQPIPQLFSHIYRTYPNAKVVLSVRNASEWVASRTTRPRAARPFAAFAHSVQTIADTDGTDRTSHPDNNPVESALAFEMHSVLVRCLVPPENLLEIDVFRTPDRVLREQVRAFLAEPPR